MNKTKKFVLLSGLITLFGAIQSISYAQQKPDAFIVDIEPSNFETSALVDMTIKAVYSNGETAKEYQGDVFIEIVEFLDSSDYVVPADGFYTFLPQDQGIKTFSKGLNIKKEGTYTIKVSDLEDENIKGEKTVTIGSHASSSDKGKINVMLPIAGGTERYESINIVGKNPEYSNSQFKIFLNDSISGEGLIDENGDLNTYITGARNGENSLQLKIIDINNIIIAESDLIKFNYSPIKDGIFNSIQVLPGNSIKQGDTVTFIVSTSEGVSSVQLKLSNGKTSPMDKIQVGNFSKEMQIDTYGTIEVSLEIINAGNKKLYTGVTNLIVERGTAIGKVRIFGDEIDKTKINVTREVIGSTPPKYKITYGTGEELMDQSAIVSTNEIDIENLEKGVIYYLRVYPVNDDGNEIGTPSEIVSTQLDADLSCIVKGIKISESMIGEKRYLIRSGVLNSEKYIIYRSDTETSNIDQMKKVGETTETRFEYPFNKFSKKDEYAFYSVVAVCKDGNEVMIDDVKKVQVGPMENIMLFLIVSLFIYTLYRLNNYSKIQ